MEPVFFFQSNLHMFHRVCQLEVKEKQHEKEVHKSFDFNMQPSKLVCTHTCTHLSFSGAVTFERRDLKTD